MGSDRRSDTTEAALLRKGPIERNFQDCRVLDVAQETDQGKRGMTTSSYVGHLGQDQGMSRRSADVDDGNLAKRVSIVAIREEQRAVTSGRPWQSFVVMLLVDKAVHYVILQSA